MAASSAAPVPHSTVPSEPWKYHSDQTLVYPLALLSDNYSYAIVDSSTQQCAFVDPADPVVIDQFLHSHPHLHFSSILTTHKHWDHSGGNEILKRQFPNVEVYGSQIDEVPAMTKAVKTGSIVQIGAKTNFAVFEVPCHTLGHLMFLLLPPSSASSSSSSSSSMTALFTGDTVFNFGCGRFFEGSGSEMHNNLFSVLPSLCSSYSLPPSSIHIWSGHEYTESNLLFCAFVEEQNEFMKEKLIQVQKKRQGKVKEISQPTTLEEEKNGNVFFRVSEEHVKRKCMQLGYIKENEWKEKKQVDREIMVLDALRKMKNENVHTKTTVSQL